MNECVAATLKMPIALPGEQCIYRGQKVSIVTVKGELTLGSKSLGLTGSHTTNYLVPVINLYMFNNNPNHK